MQRKHSVLCAAVIFLLSLWKASPAVAQKSEMVDLEAKFGKGWQCFAIPTGLAKVGAVFEQRKDKSVFFVADLKETNTTTAPVSVGSISASKQLSVGAAIKLLSVFFPSLNVSYEEGKKTAAVISGADETVGGGTVRQDAITWAGKNTNKFTPNSRIYVVREAILASGVAYSFDTTTTTAISAQLALTAPKTASPATTPSAPSSPSSSNASSPTPNSQPAKQTSTVSPPNTANQIVQTFDPKITICIHPDWIVLGNSLGGSPKPIIVPVTDDLGFK